MCQLLILRLPQLVMAPRWANTVSVGLHCKPDQENFYDEKKKESTNKSCFYMDHLTVQLTA